MHILYTVDLIVYISMDDDPCLDKMHTHLSSSIEIELQPPTSRTNSDPSGCVGRAHVEHRNVLWVRLLPGPGRPEKLCCEPCYIQYPPVKAWFGT